MYQSKSRKKFALWLVDDERTPEVVRFLWRCWTESSGVGSILSGVTSDVEWEVSFFSERDLVFPVLYGDVPVAGRKLFCLSYPLHESVDKDVVFVVDVNLWIQRPLVELSKLVSGPMAFAGDDLRRSGLAVYFPKHEDFSKLRREWLESESLGYENLAEWKSSLVVGFPELWSPREAGRSFDHCVIDLRKYDHRPWLSSVAPFGKWWNSYCCERIRDFSLLERDRGRGLIRGSLLVDWRVGGVGLDGKFRVVEEANQRHPDFYPEPQRVNLIHSNTFRNRMKRFRKRAEQFTLRANGQTPMTFSRRLKKRIKKNLRPFWDRSLRGAIQE